MAKTHCVEKKNKIGEWQRQCYAAKDAIKMEGRLQDGSAEVGELATKPGRHELISRNHVEEDSSKSSNLYKHINTLKKKKKSK